MDCTTRWSNPSNYLATGARYLWVLSQVLMMNLSLPLAGSRNRLRNFDCAKNKVRQKREGQDLNLICIRLGQGPSPKRTPE